MPQHHKYCAHQISYFLYNVLMKLVFVPSVKKSSRRDHARHLLRMNCVTTPSATLGPTAGCTVFMRLFKYAGMTSEAAREGGCSVGISVDPRCRCQHDKEPSRQGALTEAIEALELCHDVVDAVELVDRCVELLQVLGMGSVVVVLAILQGRELGRS